MEALKLLEATRQLCAQGWTQKAHARDKHNNAVDVFSRNATCFCITGAMSRALQGVESPAYYPAYHAIVSIIAQEYDNTLQDSGIVVFNDDPNRTKAQVLDVLDKAIALAKKG